MAAAPQKDLESESLREAMERNPAELDDASTSPPCGEMTKRSPGAPQPAYDPIHVGSQQQNSSGIVSVGH